MSNYLKNRKVSQLIQEFRGNKTMAEQKSLKEVFINWRKETKRELQRPRRDADQVQSNMKQQKKKDLQGDIEELKDAYAVNEFKKNPKGSWRKERKIISRSSWMLFTCRCYLCRRQQQKRSKTLSFLSRTFLCKYQTEVSATKTKTRNLNTCFYF